MTTLRIEDMTLEDLGRYVVTLPDWRYICGMVTAQDDVIIDGGLRYFYIHCIGGLDEYEGDRAGQATVESARNPHEMYSAADVPR
jgi:hypothetical protein